MKGGCFLACGVEVVRLLRVLITIFDRGLILGMDDWLVCFRGRVGFVGGVQ